VLHDLLKHQLTELGLHDSATLPDAQTWQRLLDIISATYDQTDDRRFYQALFDQTNDAVFIIALNGKYLSVNRKAAEMLGYTVGELVNLSMPQVVAPDEQQDSQKILQELIAGQTVPPYERTFYRKDGSKLLVEVNVDLVRDNDGKPIYLQSIVRDIGERKRVEAALRASEERYRTLVRNIPNLVVLMFDRDFRYILVEGALFNQNNSKQAFEGKTVWEALTPERQKLFFPYYQAALNGQKSQFEIERDGYIYEITTVPVRDEIGNITAGMHISTDITERSRAEAIIRFQAALVDHMHDAVIATDNQYHVITWNAGAERLYGWSAAEVIGRDINDVVTTPLTEEQRQEASKKLEQTGYWEREIVLLHRSGKLLNIISSVSLLRDENGQQVGLIGIERDMTERNRAEARMRALVDAIPDMIVRHDGEGRYLEIKATPTIPLNYSIPDAIGKTVWEMLPHDPNLAERVMRRIEKVLATHEMDVEEYKLTIEGEISYREARTVPSGPDEVLMLIRDITARKQVEMELRESERHYRDLFEGIDDAIFVHDMEANLLDVNEAACRRLGYSRDELLQMKTTQIDDPDFADGFYERLDRQKSGGSLSTDYGAHLTKDGRRIDIHANSKLISYRGEPAVLSVIRDITALKQAEEAIRFQATLVDQISDAVYSTDLNENILTWNRAAERLYGWQADEVIGQFAGKVVGSQLTVEQRQKAVQQIRDSGHWEDEIIHTARDGRRIEVLVSTSLLKDSSGSPSGFIAISRDITERKLAQEVIRQNEEKLRQLYHATQWQAQELTLLNRVRTAMAQEMDLDPLIRTIVKGIAEIFNYTYVSLYLLEGENLILYHQIGYTTPYPVIPLHKGIIGRSVRLGEPIFVENIVDDPDYVPAANDIVSEICVPLFDRDEIVGAFNIESTAEKILTNDDMRLMIALSEQISIAVERARLYTSLRESKEQYQKVVESVREVIFQTDERGRWAFLNPAWTEMTGYSIAETVGQSVLECIPPEDRALTGSQYGPLMKGEIPFTRYETRLMTRDRGPRWIEVHARRTGDTQGRMIGMSGTLTDITERKLNEQQAAELLAQSRTVEALRRFLTNVSHDLRTPLSVINTSLYLIRRKFDDPNSAIHHVDVLEEQVLHLARIVEDLVEMTRLDDQIVEFEFIPVHLANLVRDVLFSYESMAQSRGLTIEREADGDLPLIQADQMWLGRLVHNLVTNAIQYTPSEGTIWIKTLLADGGVVLTVRDNGIGISVEDLPYIFDRFYRADTARPADKGGAGLGLAIVRKVVDAHGGRVSAESGLGEGSTFRIWLPLNR
jgi:PAS domain S-box-containing protein